MIPIRRGVVILYLILKRVFQQPQGLPLITILYRLCYRVIHRKYRDTDSKETRLCYCVRFRSRCARRGLSPGIIYVQSSVWWLASMMVNAAWCMCPYWVLPEIS